MTARTLITALAVALLAPAAPALAALPQQSATADLASPGPNPIFYGSGSGEQAGMSVAALGDVNGDGVDDAAVGAPAADPNGRTNSGSVYVVYGRDGLATRTDLGRMGSAGVRIDGAAGSDQLGGWIANAGDVDGDGRDDLIAGAIQADPNGRSNAGAAYILTDVTRSSRIDLASLGTAGYRIEGAVAGDRAGSWVTGGGDVDGDGRDDVVVVASEADPAGRANAGSAWIVRGRPAGANVDLAALGANGFRVDGGAAGDALNSAAIAPDATGDGRADVLVGAAGSDPRGRTDAGSAWLLEGRGGSDPVDLADPAAGARIDGANAGDGLGAGVRTSPDVTGDGVAELLVGAPTADANGRANSGSLYLLPGRSLPAATDLATDSPAARIDGAQANNLVGFVAAGGGDLNDDGRADLAVGDTRFDAGRTDSGATYVLYGGSLTGTIDLATPPAAATRAGGASWFENSGNALAWVGDMNGDGRDDLLTGAPLADTGRTNGGAAYLLLGFGKPSFSYPATVDATANVAYGAARPATVRRTGAATYSISPALPSGLSLDRTTGAISGMPTVLIDPPRVLRLTMTDYAGTATVTVTVRVAPAPGACTNEPPILGANADVFTGSSGGDLIRAGGGGDAIDARAGDDCVYGEAGDDTLTGAEGADKLYAGSEHDTVRAGDGDDTVTGEGGNDTIDGDGGQDSLTGGWDRDVIHGGDGGDTVDGEAGEDTIDGDGGQDSLTGGWDRDTIRGGEGGDTVTGDEASDILAGDGGDDHVAGGTENDAIDGGAGHDVVLGDAGDDRVDGGVDADEVHGGEGVDELYGGAGDDAVWADVENDFLDGGAGNDRLWAGLGRDSAHGGVGNDVLFGEDDDDDLFGDAGDDQMHGGAHQDELRGGEGNDALAGDDGQDLVDGELGDDLLSGGEGFDNLTGDAGDDRLAGDSGDDILDGGEGTDTLDGGAGDDRLFGAAGDDVVTGGDGKDTIEETDGRDRISSGDGNDQVTLKRGGGATVDAGAGSDKVVAHNGKRDTVICGAGRDTAYVDKRDKVKGCEKRIYSKPKTASKKRRKSKKRKK